MLSKNTITRKLKTAVDLLPNIGSTKLPVYGNNRDSHHRARVLNSSGQSQPAVDLSERSGPVCIVALW